jgi:hypothetical protein
VGNGSDGNPRWTSIFFATSGCSAPRDVTREDVREWLELLVDGGAESSWVSVHLSALRTMFDKMCGREITLGLMTPRRAVKLPTVLSTTEVKALLISASIREKLLLGLMYATGMRVSEVSRLRLTGPGGPAPDGLKEPVSGGSADRWPGQKSSFSGGAARPSLEKAPCSTYPPDGPHITPCERALTAPHLEQEAPMSTNPAQVAEGIVQRALADPTAGRPHAVVVREEGDSYSIWYEIFLVRRGPGGARAIETEVGTVGYEHGRGQRLARDVASRVGQGLGVPTFLDEWQGGEPYIHPQASILEVPNHPEVAFDTFIAGLDALVLPKGFIQQLGGLDEDLWQRTEPRCLQEDLRLSMLLREHAHLLDGRALIRADLDGSMAVWAALALAELGWAPQFLCGPALHRGHDWSNVVGALKHVAHPLLRAIERLGEDAPVAQITDSDADVLQFTRTADEDAAVPPLDEAFLAAFHFDTQREHVAQAHENAMRDRRRAIRPRPEEIAAHHRCSVRVVTYETASNSIARYTNGVDADLEAAGLVPFCLSLNPFADPPR